MKMTSELKLAFSEINCGFPKQELKKFKSEWNQLLISLKRNLEKGMISFVDSDLNKLGLLLQNYKQYIPKNKYDEMINTLNSAVRHIWLSA